MRDSLHESSVTANGIRFHYAEQGEGPLILLLHGFPERWFSWRAQIPALASLGYRVVAPDLRGYGDSERPPTGYDLDTLARDVAELITALGEDTATVIGHDWGGAITWESVSRYPDRITRAAVLNCPHPAVMFHTLRASPRQLARSWYMFFFNLPWLPERLLARDGGSAVRRMFLDAAVDRAPFTPELLDPYCRSVAHPGAVAPMLAYYRSAIRSALHPREAMRRLDSYGVIERPTLLVWAEEDIALGMELIAPHVRYTRDLHVRRIPRCGHFVQQEQPDTVNAILTEWLSATR